MRPNHCVLCGVLILEQDESRSKAPSWMRQFRAVYYTPTEVRLSGVGLCKSNLLVPLEENDQWDVKPCRLSRIPLMGDQPDDDGRHGYIFHDACWCLLKKCHPGKKVPVDQLLDILFSLLVSNSSGTAYIWGHGYRGLFNLSKKYHYPWQTSMIRRSSVTTSMKNDPFHVPEVEALLNSPSVLPPTPNESFKHCQGRTYRDCFLSLPLEMIEIIAAYLPVKDALNLRHVSRAFVPLFSSQRFWAKRFRIDGNRGFLFEAYETQAPEPRDWRSLYHLTNRAHLSPALRNRERVWLLNRSLAKKLALMWNDWSSLQPIPRKLPGCRWEEVHKDLLSNGQCILRGHEGLRYHKQETSMPSCLSRIGVSIIRDGKTSYVAGIHIIADGGLEIHLGYTARENFVFTDVGHVKGIIPSIGPNGIHALQIVRDDDSLSQWLGCPDEGARTKRLVFKDSIAALSAGFDGYKMVRLAVSGKKKNLTGRLRQYSRLLNDSLWLPCVPDPDVYLNETSFMDYYASKSEFKPMCWIKFGGPGGSYLRFLTGISVVFDPCKPVSIEFDYADESIPLKCRGLFRYRPKKKMRAVRFAIDGPGGEIIERISVARDSVIGEFKIYTNRGRSCHFEGEKKKAPKPNQKFLRISLESGTIPTGFYGHQSKNKDIDSLGVISELVEI